MCLKCDDAFDCATQLLGDVMYSRTAHGGQQETAAQNTIESTHIILHSIEPYELQGNPFVQNICLALAAAVERLVALEQCGIST